MKIKIQFASNLFLTASVLFFADATGFAQTANPLLSDTIQHCGCDKKEGIEMYVQNIINDAQKRGLSCETTKIHAFACITSYCSICKDHPNLMENCIKMGADYFAVSPGFCQPASNLTAGHFLPPGGGWAGY